MMDALGLLAKQVTDAAVSAQGAKAAKSDDVPGKGAFSNELKNVSGDRQHGKRGKDAEEAAALKTDGEAAQESAVTEKPARGLSAFAALKAEWQSAVEGSGDGAAGNVAENLSGAIRQGQTHGKDADAASIAAHSGRARSKGADFSDLGGEDSGKAITDKTLAARVALKTGKGVDEAVKTAQDDISGEPETVLPDDAGEAVVAVQTEHAAADMLGMLAGDTSRAIAAVGGKQAAGVEWRETKQTGASSGKVDGETDGDGADTSLPDAGQDRLFRLQRSEDSGRSLDLKIGRDGNGGLDVEARRSSMGQAETVNVVEARRYLGFNAPSNSSALTTAMAANDEWIGAMHPSARLANEAQLSSTGQVVNTLKLELNPVSLGAVTATLRLVGDELSVHLTVQTSAAYRELKDDASGMLGALRAQGFSVDQVTVSMGASATQQDTGSDAGGRFAQQQQNMQQMAGDGGRNGSGQGARQDARGNGVDSVTSTANGRANEAEQGSYGGRGAGGVRPDHVYI